MAPNKPATQSVQAPAPAREYFPATHWDAVADADPAGQAYPAVQLPEQAAEVRPEAEPKVPAGQSVQLEDPAELYFPMAH